MDYLLLLEYLPILFSFISLVCMLVWTVRMGNYASKNLKKSEQMQLLSVVGTWGIALFSHCSSSIYNVFLEETSLESMVVVSWLTLFNIVPVICSYSIKKFYKLSLFSFGITCLNVAYFVWNHFN